MTPQSLHELKEACEAAKKAREAWEAGRDGPNEHGLSVSADEAIEALDEASQPYENVLLALIEERDALIADYERMRGAGEIVSAWLERWGSHVGGCRGGNACTCGLTNAKYEIRQALTQGESS